MLFFTPQLYLVKSHYLANLVLRNPTLFVVVVVLASLLTLGFNLTVVIGLVPATFADDGYKKKECKKNEGDNNCNDTKKNASPELECKHEIKDNKDSTIDSECTNNSQILIDSNILESPSDGGGNGGGNGNGDTTRPTVVSVDPNDGQNDIPLNTQIKVVFSESMDQDTLDDGSVDIFCQTTCDIDNVGVNADPSDKSVTYTLDRQLEPGTRYEAQLDFNIQDIDGNFLDCSDSNDVDSSCTWQFETTGNGNANIELSPTTGSIGSSVHITGTGFDPNHEVTVTFGLFVVATSTTNNIGEFSVDFPTPLSLPGSHTVSATDGSNSDSATFTVTSSVNPIITIDPAFGPVGTQVEIIGINFDPTSKVDIFFFGAATDTLLSTVTSNSSGGFSVSSTIPNELPGQYTVEAHDQGSNADQTIFTVTPGASTNQQLSTNSATETPNTSSMTTQGLLPF